MSLASLVVESRVEAVRFTGLRLSAADASFRVRVDGLTDRLLEYLVPGAPWSPGYALRLDSDGGRAELTARALVALPELVAAVLLKSAQANAGSAPILAGSVDLIRRRGYAGRTSVLFVAPGERFSLGWGPEPELRVQRDVEVGEDTQKRLSSWEKRRHRTTVRLYDIGPRSRTVEVTEGAPVSEIDKVKVVHDEEGPTGRRRPDADGFVSWTVRLQPFRHESCQPRYTLEKHGSVKGV